jgi:hypothetical protein
LAEAASWIVIEIKEGPEGSDRKTFKIETQTTTIGRVRWNAVNNPNKKTGILLGEKLVTS